MGLVAAPPAPQRDAVQAWQEAADDLARQVDRWAARLADGALPLRAGEEARLRSLVAAVRALRPMDTGMAQVTAAAMDRATTAVQASMQAAVDALPAHALAAGEEAAAALGWAQVANPAAIAQVVNGGIGQLTGDFLTLNAGVQAALLSDVATSIAAGEAPRDLAKRLRQSWEPSLRLGQSRSVMIARTVSARAYDQASLFQYQKAAADGILYGWRWVARPGACPVCRALHGTVFKAGDDTFRHPNCTCTTVPVLMDEPAARTPFGERWDPYPGTDASRLERVTSRSGWTHWQQTAKAATDDPIREGTRVLTTIKGRDVDLTWRDGRWRRTDDGLALKAEYTDPVTVGVRNGTIRPVGEPPAPVGKPPLPASLRNGVDEIHVKLPNGKPITSSTVRGVEYDPDEVEATVAWVGGRNWDASAMMRGEALPGWVQPDTAQYEIDMIRHVMAKSVLPERTTFWRGVQKGAIDGGVKRGDVFEDKAFASASTSKGVAEEYLSGGESFTEQDVFDGVGYLFEIRVPAGHRAIPVSDMLHHPHDAEWIMDEAQHMTVVSVDPFRWFGEPIDGLFHVVLEVR